MGILWVMSANCIYGYESQLQKQMARHIRWIAGLLDAIDSVASEMNSIYFQPLRTSKI